VVPRGDSATRVLALPADVSKAGPVYFVSLALSDAAGKVVGSGFYWLSSKPETFDWGKSTWYTTPTLSYADFTALSRLPRVQVKVSSKTERRGPESLTHVALENPGTALAFFVRCKVVKGAGGDEVLPVLWQDNYVSLLPGEKREIAASYRTKDLGGAKPVVEVSGVNVGP
jgi:exo-1,4-beta-D-glucosaminidase